MKIKPKALIVELSANEAELIMRGDEHTIKQLREKLERMWGGGPNHICQKCNREFPTFQGMRVHQAKYCDKKKVKK